MSLKSEYGVFVDVMSVIQGNTSSPSLTDKLIFCIYKFLFWQYPTKQYCITNENGSIPHFRFNKACKFETALLSAYIAAVFYSSKTNSKEEYFEFQDEIILKLYRLICRQCDNISSIPHPDIIDNHIEFYSSNSFDSANRFDLEHLTESVIPVLLGNTESNELQFISEPLSLHDFTKSAIAFKELSDFLYRILEEFINLIEESIDESTGTSDKSTPIKAENIITSKTEANSSYDISGYPKTHRIKPSAIITALAVIAAVILIVIGIIKINNGDFATKTTYTTTAKNTQQQYTEPQSGYIFERDFDADYGSELTIHSSASESCVVKLKTRSGATRLSFYVRAGDTVTVEVPYEHLYVYFASGETWYGRYNLFGEDTNYSKDSKICNFEDYTWEYTLYPVSSGNFSQTPVDEDEF